MLWRASAKKSALEGAMHRTCQGRSRPTAKPGTTQACSTVKGVEMSPLTLPYNV
jgi:hypothetical protein